MPAAPAQDGRARSDTAENHNYRARRTSKAGAGRPALKKGPGLPPNTPHSSGAYMPFYCTRRRTRWINCGFSWTAPKNPYRDLRLTQPSPARPHRSGQYGKTQTFSGLSATRRNGATPPTADGAQAAPPPDTGKVTVATGASGGRAHPDEGTANAATKEAPAAPGVGDANVVTRAVRARPRALHLAGIQVTTAICRNGQPPPPTRTPATSRTQPCSHRGLRRPARTTATGPRTTKTVRIRAG